MKGLSAYSVTGDTKVDTKGTPLPTLSLDDANVDRRGMGTGASQTRCASIGRAKRRMGAGKGQGRARIGHPLVGSLGQAAGPRGEGPEMTGSVDQQGAGE